MISDATDLQKDVTCDNPTCNCSMIGALLGATYCSDSCENAGTNPEIAQCACGHPPCDAM